MKLIDLATRKDIADNATAFLEDLCDRLGFDYASYATVNPVTGDVQGYATYSEEWKQHYGRKGFHHFDPTLYQAAKSIAPVDWARFAQNEKFQIIFRDAADFGITDRGMTVPIRGPYGDCGLLNVTRDCDEDEWKQLAARVMGDLQVSAVNLHDTIMRSGTLSATLFHPNLSTRELEILKWAADGKSQHDIGDILSISHRTVEVHLRSARDKLGALTTTQAVGRAVGLGLILPG